MATSSSTILSSSLFSTRALTENPQTQKLFLFNGGLPSTAPNTKRRAASFRAQAAKLPPGVVVPKAEPQFNAPFAGFTRTAETWNSRACMIGLIGTFIVELILNKGILQLIGVEIGKGLDIPL